MNGMPVNANTVQFDAAGSAAPRRPYRLAAGLAASLALHAVLLYAWRQHHPRSSALIATPGPSTGEAEPAGGKGFDRDAALQVARAMANEPDPAEPYATETKLARAIASAKRRDCKDGIPGGLLAPLILLLDKKDSGCKW